MIIILNDGSLVNFFNVSMILNDAILKDFGKCRCYVYTLTLYSSGNQKVIIAEEANGNTVNNVLSRITEAAASGKSIIDFREMGLTDGDKVTEMKQELEKAYEVLERSYPVCSKQTDSLVKRIQEKKEAIVKVFHMPEDKAEKFLESDSQYMLHMVAKKKREGRQIQAMHAVKCEDDALEKEMRRRGYEFRKGGK